MGDLLSDRLAYELVGGVVNTMNNLNNSPDGILHDLPSGCLIQACQWLS